MPNMVAGSITAQLIATGWSRDDSPADAVAECGETPGYCVRLARWSHPHYGRRAMCAQHALAWQHNRPWL